MNISIGITINSDYVSGFTPLLESFAKAQTAWFIPAKLWSDYSGSSIRIRRASDNAETDIGFAGGLLDESAISDHCGASEGFIVTAYDQSGNSNDWTQATATLQPKIYDGSVVIKAGSYPAAHHVNVEDNLSITLTTPATATAFHIHRAERSFFLQNFASGSRFYGFAQDASSSACHSASGTPTFYINGSSITDTRDAFHDNAINTNCIGSVTGLNLSSAWGVYNTTYIGSATWGACDYVHGGIIYDSDQSANRTAIESALNDFLGFY